MYDNRIITQVPAKECLPEYEDQVNLNRTTYRFR